MKLNTKNPALLRFTTSTLLIEILGGIKLSNLDRLRVTLKISGKETFPLRYNIDLYNSDSLEKLIRRASEYFEKELKEVRTILMSLIEKLEAYRLNELESSISSKPIELTDQRKEAAIGYLKQKKLMDILFHDVAYAAEVIAEEENALLLYLILCSKKMPEPLSTIIYGESGSGKTTLMQGVASLLPPEDVVAFTSLSKTSLYYMDDLIDKAMLIEDLSGTNDEVLFALREIASNQKLTRSTTERNTKGDITCKTITLKTKASMVSCTTSNTVYLDNENRSIPIYIDPFNKVREQAIFDYKKQKASGAIDLAKINSLKELLRDVHRVLSPLSVINPYAEKLRLPQGVKSPKRSFQIYLNFIATIAWINQYSRKVKMDPISKEKYVEVTTEDILWANRLLNSVFLSKSDELSSATRNFYELLKQNLQGLQVNTFTISNIKHLSHISNIKRYLKELRLHEYIKIISGSKYKGFEYRLVEQDNWQELQLELKKALEKQQVDLV